MPKVARAKKVKNDKAIIVLVAFSAFLVAMCGLLLYALQHKTAQYNTVVQTTPHVSLGAMQFTFKDSKATRRTDDSIKSLRTFLDAEALNTKCPVGSPAYYYVMVNTKDESQVLLNYGCGAADSPAFAVKQDGKWKALSPTNHFNQFRIPDCAYANDNKISPEIAPVCVSDIQTETSTYQVR